MGAKPFEDARRASRAFTLIELLVIVAVLSVCVAMLIPLTRARRELARRAACQVNLEQIGKAMEAYLGAYGNYYPSWAGMGIHQPGTGAMQPDGTRLPTGSHETQNMHMLWEAGVVTDAKGRSVRTYDGDWYMTRGTSHHDASMFANLMAFRWRTLTFGAKDGYGEDSKWTAGNLNAAPIGLGWLPYTGLIEDVRVFYCPSGANIPVYNAWGQACENSGNLRNLARLGGYKADELFYGDYTWIKPASAYDRVRDLTRRGVSGQYNYRNVARSQFLSMHPAYVEDPAQAPWGAGNWQSYYCWDPFVIDRQGRIRGWFGKACPPDLPSAHRPYVLGTRPMVQTQAFQPDFATPRALLGRALVSDTFDKEMDGPTGGVGKTGAALWCHEDGYNVLYGDNHTEWYGDPDRKTMAFQLLPESGAKAMTLNHPLSATGSLCNTFEWPWEWRLTRGRAMWHWFDEHAGYDCGTSGPDIVEPLP